MVSKMVPWLQAVTRNACNATCRLDHFEHTERIPNLSAIVHSNVQVRTCRMPLVLCRLVWSQMLWATITALGTNEVTKQL